eukprot:CAMPEP_0202882288 /NCGR_PEP_ID=MMETSP1391-20130828/37789_1 /ASSEMBLY_ACC=CAM_ASM_000867 /TAXON_ID=1034604 /ORGANISM="Chlamydomonas leiostraca, Strain SAG 11-49" /LENGTH=183 /DNA_ID=CAMNT_0049565119 /DNA_START=48 /DNA_END=599 /DNA_ORIENTATION=-
MNCTARFSAAPTFPYENVTAASMLVLDMPAVTEGEEPVCWYLPDLSQLVMGDAGSWDDAIHSLDLTCSCVQAASVTGDSNSSSTGAAGDAEAVEENSDSNTDSGRCWRQLASRVTLLLWDDPLPEQRANTTSQAVVRLDAGVCAGRECSAYAQAEELGPLFDGRISAVALCYDAATRSGDVDH